MRPAKPDLLDIAFISAAGNEIPANLGLIFAIGVGVGIAWESHGIRSEKKLDRDRLRALVPGGFALASPTSLHLIAGGEADLWAEHLQALLAKAGI